MYVTTVLFCCEIIENSCTLLLFALSRYKLHYVFLFAMTIMLIIILSSCALTMVVDHFVSVLTKHLWTVLIKVCLCLNIITRFLNILRLIVFINNCSYNVIKLNETLCSFQQYTKAVNRTPLVVTVTLEAHLPFDCTLLVKFSRDDQTLTRKA